MKILFEFAFLAIFFAVFKFYGIYPAIASAIILYGAQLAFLTIKHRKIDKIQLVTFVMILVLGGSSLFFQNEMFFKWKPSVVYWLFALAILGAQIIRRQPTFASILSHAISLPIRQWYWLDYAWTIFFAAIGVVNLIVAYSFSTEAWVYFKLFGILGALIVFMVVQILWLSRYAQLKHDSKAQ